MINHDYSIRIISLEDLFAAGCYDIGKVMNICSQALIDYNDGKIIFPEKVSTVFDESSQNRINCLPAGLKTKNIYGMKWVSVFPGNPGLGRDNLSAVVLLSEMETGFPVALMEAGMITNLRTAAMGGLAAKYLANPNPTEIGFIGAGELAKSHFLIMKEVFPSLKICKVASRTNTTEKKFIDDLCALYPDVEFQSCNGNYENAVNKADIIITAISGQDKILKPEWIKDGAFYCHVAGLEDDFGVAFKASKIVCDDWYTVKHRTQTISQMYKLGLLKDSDIYGNLGQIIRGELPGRENEKEFIYFNSVGLSFLDIAVASWMYEKVCRTDVGKLISIKDHSMFDLISL